MPYPKIPPHSGKSVYGYPSSSSSTNNTQPQPSSSSTPRSPTSSQLPQWAPAAAGFAGVALSAARRRPSISAASSQLSRLSSMGSRNISYGPGLQPRIDGYRERSSTLNASMSEVEQRELETARYLDSLPPNHDVHTTPGYRDGFLKSRELSIGMHAGRPPSMDPHGRHINLMTGSADELAHEVNHYNNYQNGLTNSGPQNIASELYAFQAQRQVHREVTGSNTDPASFDGMDPEGLARKYEGKANYPGDFESSLQATQTKKPDSRISEGFAGLVHQQIQRDAGPYASHYAHLRPGSRETVLGYMLRATNCADRAQLGQRFPSVEAMLR